MTSSQVVGQGERIGVVGGDPGDRGRGSSIGAHCHFWTTRDGVRLRPEDLEWETDTDKAEIERALGVIWGWAEALEVPPGLKRRAQQRQAAHELKDAVRSIKEEVVL